MLLVGLGIVGLGFAWDQESVPLGAAVAASECKFLK